MVRKKIEFPNKVRCCDCKHARPVTHEFPAYDGTPVFCTCEHKKYYQQMRWEKHCENYKAKS